MSGLRQGDNAILAALADRLRSAAPMLTTRALPPPSAVTDAALEASELLGILVEDVAAAPHPERVWLLLVAVSASLPQADLIRATVRTLELEAPAMATLWLLDRCVEIAASTHLALRHLSVVTNSVLVEVNQAAREDAHTGVKAVVRGTMPLWSDEHQLTLVAWTDDGCALRTLSASEHQRVLNWPELDTADPRDGTDAVERKGRDTIVAPWRSVVMLPDIAESDQSGRLAALAEYSGNHVVAIGYDCIPVISADLMPWGLAGRFADHLSVVKHMRRVAAISASAAREFQGFVDALPTQGLIGPTVTRCQLPSPRYEGGGRTTTTAVPSVVSVGSFEPRKNHLALLQAAELLWQDGLRFELVLIGGMAWDTEISQRITELEGRGRPLTVLHRAPQPVVDRAYEQARFSVFASLHEGYGLPVAESLAAGTPVITSNFGSMLEIAKDGGALIIDPRQDSALVEAMRQLLVDDAKLAELRAEIQQRPARGWSDYAAELWRELIQPELAALGASPEEAVNR